MLAGQHHELFAFTARQATARLDDGESFQLAQPGLQARASLLHPALHALHRCPEVDLDRPGLHTEFAGPARHVSHTSRLA